MIRQGFRQFGIRKTLATATAAVLLPLTGCGDFFAQKPTEVQSMAILEELSQVRESPHTNNPLPEIYRQPPSRLSIKGGTKLFYYSKHHPAGHLAGLVKEQMGIDASVNAATNQLVLFCKDDVQAGTVEDYLLYLDVPPVQVNVDCLILERFGDITADWETSIMIQNFLGEGITMGEGRGRFNNQGNLTALDPAFPGAAIRETERAKFGMDFGFWRNKGVDGRQVRALVDVLISHGYLKILLNPTLETVNGQKATVTIKDFAPTQEVQVSRGGGDRNVYNITQYMWVENTLTVTPHVYADGSIGLTTDIKIGSRSKPEGVVQRAIITERSINVAENRVLPGESLIIGGMRKSEKRSVIRGIPFFKDLPLVGILFSSKDFEEKGTEIIFILTPSVSSGGQDHSRVVQDIRTKHADPDYKMGIKQMLTEAFDSGVYGTMVERQAAEAELKRMEAELERDQARHRAQTERQRADKIAAEAEKYRQTANQLLAQAQKAAQEAQAAADQAAEAKTLTEAQRLRVIELQQKKDAALAEALQAQQLAAEADRQAQAAAQEAQAAEALSRRAAEEAERAAEQARQQAENEAAQSPPAQPERDPAEEQ